MPSKTKILSGAFVVTFERAAAETTFEVRIVAGKKGKKRNGLVTKRAGRRFGLTIQYGVKEPKSLICMCYETNPWPVIQCTEAATMPCFDYLARSPLRPSRGFDSACPITWKLPRPPPQSQGTVIITEASLSELSDRANI